MLLLDQDITRNGRVYKKILEPDKFEARNNKEYKVKTIINSIVYYLISWKDYQKEENNWEPSIIVINFQKLINIFHKEYPKKLIITSLSVDSISPMVRPIVPKKQQKQKYGYLSKRANKKGRNQA